MAWKAAQGLQHLPSSLTFQEPSCCLHQCCSGLMLQQVTLLPSRLFFQGRRISAREKAGGEQLWKAETSPLWCGWLTRQRD